jgi:hypothetical protein
LRSDFSQQIKKKKKKKEREKFGETYISSVNLNNLTKFWILQNSEEKTRTMCGLWVDGWIDGC